MPKIDEKIFDTYKHMNSRKSVDWFSWWVWKKIDKRGSYIMSIDIEFLKHISPFAFFASTMLLISGILSSSYVPVFIFTIVNAILIIVFLLSCKFNEEFLERYHKENKSLVVNIEENGIKKTIYMSRWYYNLTTTRCVYQDHRIRNYKRKHWTNTEVTNRVISLWEYQKYSNGKLAAQKKLEFVEDIEEFQKYYQLK